MRKILRRMAKVRMAWAGYSHVNRCMSVGRWREFVDAYPVNLYTGKKMQRHFHGKKRGRGHWSDCVYQY